MSVRTRIRSFEQQNEEVVTKKSFEEVAKKSFSPSKNNDPFSSSNYRGDSPARTSGSSSSNASNNKHHPPVTIRKSSPASRKNAMSASTPSPSPLSKQNSSTSSVDSISKNKTLGKKAVVLPSKNGESSPTMMKVKQNRKSRIQRETSNSSKSPSPSPPIAAGSLKQRRNLMKYQKQRAREQQQEQPDNSNGIGIVSGSLSGSHHSANSGISSGRRFVHSISQESSGEMNIESSIVVPQRPQQRLPQQSMKHAPPQGGGGEQQQQQHNHTYDSPTRYTSAQIAKSHRMQRMRNNSNNINYAANTGKDPPAVMSPPHGSSKNYRSSHQQQQQQQQQPHGRGQPYPYETTTGPAPASPVLYVPSEEDNTEFNSVCKSPKHVDDDDATLTSVRQIMGGADHQPTASSSLMSGVTSSTMQQSQPSLQPKRYFNHDAVSSPKNSDFVVSGSSKNGRNGNTSSGAEESTSFLKKKKLSRGSGHSSRDGRSSRGSNNVLMKAASSTDYDSDGGEDRRVEVKRNKNKSRSRNEATDSAMDVFLQKTRSSRVEEDERTFDYGELNDSVASFDTANRHALKQANVNHDGMKSTAFVKEEPRPLLVNNEDLEFYTKNLNTPIAKTTAGVVAAATAGAVVLGPVGLLVGAAAVGIAVGAMQVPEEQRENVKEKVTAGFVQASDAMSVSCVTMCHQTGVGEHIPPEVARCYDPDVAKEFEESKKSGGSSGDGTNGTVAGGTGTGTGIGGGVSYNASMHDNENPNNGKNNKSQDDKNHDKQSHTSGAGNNIVNNAMRGLMPDNHGNKAPLSRGAMCLRDVRIIPVSQIYGLQPSQQPRAWLDVMASAHTSMDEKNEAMEEICIIAKDKNNAAVLLQEGILDSLIWILTRHLEKIKRDDNKVSPRETSTAKLAASCCVTLGKAHCALVHTGGDLLLMSMYEHGKVPEERQLAQMLYETPHHHPVVTDPLSSSGQEQFAIKNLAMHEAQELARSIKPLTDEW